MSNRTVPAAAEGMPKQIDYSTTLSNLTNVVALAVDVLIESYRREGDTCVLPVLAADKVISILVLARDASSAELAAEMAR